MMSATPDAPAYDGYHKYDHVVAATYEKDRQVEAHWWKEDAFVREYFGANPTPRVLDIPVGTGRFFPHYQRAEVVVGVDVSRDMLDQAQAKLGSLPDGVAGSVEIGDVLSLRFGDGEFTHALVWRLFHLLPPQLLPAAVGELCRVAAREVILQTYVAPGDSGRPSPSSPVARVTGTVRRLGRSLSQLVRAGAQSPMTNAAAPTGAAESETAAPAPWSHIQSYSHAQPEIDALFRRHGFAPRFTRQLDTYDSCDVRVTVYQR